MNHDVIIGYAGLIFTLILCTYRISFLISRLMTSEEAYRVFVTQKECKLLHRRAKTTRK